MLISGTWSATAAIRGHVAPEPDDGQIDDGVDPVLLELLEAGHGQGPGPFLVPFRRGLLDLRAQDEDVLVHEGRTRADCLSIGPRTVFTFAMMFSPSPCPDDPGW